MLDSSKPIFEAARFLFKFLFVMIKIERKTKFYEIKNKKKYEKIQKNYIKKEKNRNPQKYL